MNPERDELEALARATDALLESLEPRELAERFLGRAAELFGAQAGLLSYLRGPAPPILASLNIAPADAERVAAELLGAVREDPRACRAWAEPLRLAGAAGWRETLAARLGRGSGQDGVLALFSSRRGAFDPRRDCRLLRLTGRHAAVALDNAALLAETRRQAEQLAVQAEELERVHAALELHSRELERTLAARSRFFAAMSHELRTPINAILGYNQILEEGVYGELAPAQAGIANKIAASAHQMLSLVGDLLDLSKIDAGHLDVRRDRVDLPAIIAEAASAIEIHARNKGLDLAVDVARRLPPIETDPGRVRQILLNLLSNAVKFTPRGSVTVEARHFRHHDDLPAALRPGCSPGQDGWIAIAVRDTGVGIPVEQRVAIFGEFVQLADPAADAVEPGTGLGLAISSRLARLLGGDLTVDSEIGVRSTFTLYLPCPCPALPPTPADA